MESNINKELILENEKMLFPFKHKEGNLFDSDEKLLIIDTLDIIFGVFMETVPPDTIGATITLIEWTHDTTRFFLQDNNADIIKECFMRMCLMKKNHSQEVMQ